MAVRQIACAQPERASQLNAYLDNHAFLLEAILELLQSDFGLRDLKFAQPVAEGLLHDSEDKDKCGFYFTGPEPERIIHRPQRITAMLSGKSIAGPALWRLRHPVGNKAYLDAAERALRSFYLSTHAQPMAHVSLIQEYLEPPAIAAVRRPAEAFAACCLKRGVVCAEWRERFTGGLGQKLGHGSQRLGLS